MCSEARKRLICKIVRRFLSTEGIRDDAVFAAMTVLGGGAAYAAVSGIVGRYAAFVFIVVHNIWV